MVDFNLERKLTGLGIDKEKFQMMVAERAYYKFEKRGFITGYEIDDWFEAELEVKNQYLYWSLDVE